jgi:hypothetical protein
MDLELIIDKIDQVYDSLSIHRAILVCNDQSEVDVMMAQLESRNYSCANSYTTPDSVRMLVVTYLGLSDADSRIDETTVIFTLDDSVIGDLCAIAQENNVDLVVSLTK